MSDDTQQDVTAAKRKMDAAVTAAQNATAARIDAQQKERAAKDAARQRRDEYVAALTAQTNAALGVKPRTGGGRRRATEDAQQGAQVFAMNGAR